MLLLATVGPLHAEALTPVRPTELPALQHRAPLAGLARVDGRAFAVAADGAWSLEEGARAWTPLRWPADAQPADVVAVVEDGKRAYALLAQGADRAVRGVAQLGIRDGALNLQKLPPLPEALHDPRGALSADSFYLSGRGADGHGRLLRLDFADERPHWTAMTLWPGGAPALSLVAQTRALFAVVPEADGERVLRWSADRGWTRPSTVPGRLVPGSGRATGQAHILYLVRDAAAADAPARVQTYQTVTAAWAILPGAQAVAATRSAAWTDGLVWARAAPGGSAFTAAQVQSSKLRLHWLDWVVIVVYLAGMIGIGLYFYLREKRGSTANFFVGNRSIPFWAAGISLYAANTSSISFIAIPAKAFETNWQYMANNIIAVFGLMFVAVWIVPLLRRLDLMSVFSYLETRFHPSIRMLASALCIFVQIGSRMSVILFLPALAIATITGISVFWSVLLMGGFTIVYTAMGGMKAVIWTDFVQVIVKMGGAVFAIVFMIWSLKGGFGEFWSTAMAENKMHTFDFSFDLTKATVWGFIFLVLFEVVLTFPKDQVLMQRTLSTKSDREAGRSIWAFAAIMIPGGIIFYTIGTALFAYYRSFPERMNPLLPIDATFPMFIAAELPVGVTGLIIAGIFAAAMATLSGIMNSVATLISVDFYEKLAKNRTPKQSVFFAEIMTVVVGLVGIGTALLLSRFDIHSLFDVSIELAGLLGGGFAGAYTLGMFTRRANWQGVAIGIAGSIVLTLGIWTLRAVHPYYYLAISIALCIVIGYLASYAFPPPSQSLEGLTIYRRKRGSEPAVAEPMPLQGRSDV
ncbi:sodium:solute symporter [Lysobacter silvisoli]|uniref:sodium:solute symporter n=1 Tax=Lysobacter silvisoli TaxID=2293254 RepID=UPI001E597306|nr:sodium:solute symporter [Lysobacter silvisoli]